MKTTSVISESNNDDGDIETKLLEVNTSLKSTTKNNNNNMSNKCNSNINSPKMGSRRIFTPQFKLQVLESYRNDSDCKGNQRATARKYNIHRRQIQKWLQCESNLRSSVTNLNQNNMKHQFHNISRHAQQQQQQQQQQLQHISMGSATNHSHYSHHQQHMQPLSLDTVRQKVNSLTASSVANGAGSHEMFAAANLAAVVAAAAAAGAAGTMSLGCTSTPTNPTNHTHSPLRPTALNGVASVNNNSTVATSLMQHQHYSMIYSPAVGMTVPPVPILTHHISPQIIHHQYQYHHNQSSHVHNMQTIPEARDTTAFVPTVCLPVPTATTNTALLNNNRDSREWIQTVGLRNCVTDYTCADVLKKSHSETSLNDIKDENMSIFKAPQSGVAMVPIDLSLRIRRENLEEITSDFGSVSQTTASLSEFGSFDYASIKNNSNTQNNVVDLTYRKRKSFVIQTELCELPEKHSKVSADETHNDVAKNNKSKHTIVNPKDIVKENKTEVEEDLIVDVDGEEKSITPPLKPIKLFKPYLLDSNTEEDSDLSKGFEFERAQDIINEQKAPIIWSNHPECLSPRSFDSRQCSSRESYFQSPSIEKCPFPFGSPPLQKSQISVSDHHHRNNTPNTSKVSSNFCCPKGSPVSGYESSSSTYSENSFRSDAIDHSSRSYRFDLKMQRVYTDTMSEHQSHIQRWLNHGTPPPESSASIVLYA